MKSSIEYLPIKKQKELRLITEAILESVQPEKIILFGSYARGKWVESQHMEGGALHEYISDYDILVILPRSNERIEHQIENIEDRFDFKASVTVIAHSIDYINKRLAEGHYFFSDIKKEGILLYDAGNIPLAEEQDHTPEEKSRLSKEHFEHWFPDAKGFLRGVIMLYDNDGDLKMAMFNLHQAAEKAYSAAMLVFTGYKPRTHNLGKLIRYCRIFSSELAGVIPHKTKEEKHYYNLLKNAYIDARYKKEYTITREELAFLIEKVKELQVIADRICKEKIAEFDRLAAEEQAPVWALPIHLFLELKIDAFYDMKLAKNIFFSCCKFYLFCK